ncbi:hypothetical protein PAHAL_8G226400 [Panicum hallii]|uniref:Uncharacterized protein n=1 Tax=Panicum hallii TaxID=206008 RepID=A0A2T8I9W7_9POAL|nr:hypothetical protein PAHAL_8G226400 [Panicum hallii]
MCPLTRVINRLLNPPINFGMIELTIIQTRLPNHQVYAKFPTLVTMPIGS